MLQQEKIEEALRAKLDREKLEKEKLDEAERARQEKEDY